MERGQVDVVESDGGGFGVIVEEGWNGNCRDMKAGNGRGISVLEVGLVSKVTKGFGLILEKVVDREGGLK